MRKIKFLIPITVILVAVITFGFTLIKPEMSDQKADYTVNVNVKVGNCPCEDCTKYVVLNIDGDYQILPYTGVSTYTFTVSGSYYPISSICATVVYGSDCTGCDYYSTTDCETNISSPPDTIDLEVEIWCE